MSARKRDSLDRSPSSESQMTYTRFMQLFPDNDTCLEYLKDRFYADGTACPKCEKETKFHRIKGRAAYGCQFCGHQVYPTAGTIFHRSTTSLQLWFWAIFLMSSTRCGISAKQLEREIGVTYKTAHRMFKQIRSLLTDDNDPLGGKVEMDETLVGGKPRMADRAELAERGIEGRRFAQEWAKKKDKVFAAVERGGRVHARVVPDRTRETLDHHAKMLVLPSSMVFTDDWLPYRSVGRGFASHHRVNHSANIYVEGDVHTNTIEGFFGLLKNGIRGVYHSVSSEYLQTYLDEYAWRYNHRGDTQPMFWTILENVEKAA